MNERTGVIYRIPCSTCDEVYKGEFGTQVKGAQEGALISSDGVYYTSAVAEHAIKNNHKIDWNNAKVVDYQQNIHQRCYLQLWYIRRNESPMNRETGTLPEVYNSLAIVK